MKPVVRLATADGDKIVIVARKDDAACNAFTRVLEAMKKDGFMFRFSESTETGFKDSGIIITSRNNCRICGCPLRSDGRCSNDNCEQNKPGRKAES